MYKYKKDKKNSDSQAVSISIIKNIGIFSWAIIGFLAIIALFFYIIYLMKAAIIPLLIGIIIAYMLIPVVRLFKRRMRKIFAVSLTYFLFLAIIFVLMFFIIPLVIEQFKTFVEKIPFYLEGISKFLNDFLKNSPIMKNLGNIIGTEAIPANFEEISKYILNEFNLTNINIFQSATTITKTVFNIILNFIIGPILGFYILRDTDIIVRTFLKIIPRRFKLQTATVLNKINNVFGKYVRGQLIISLIVGVMCTIVLLILRVDFAVLLGFIAGIFNMIPFLGPVIGAIPASLTALFISPLRALLVILLFIAIQQIDNYFISPNIMKYQVGVHPGLIIFSLIAGGAVFGWFGLLLAVPTVAIIQEILRYYLIEKKQAAS
ncbi:MAG: AI-2E family transporter [Actinobacteria bacterium]|nr:AI-2E family transporter [Actinomycetota bacterium]